MGTQTFLPVANFTLPTNQSVITVAGLPTNVFGLIMYVNLNVDYTKRVVLNIGNPGVDFQGLNNSLNTGDTQFFQTLLRGGPNPMEFHLYGRNSTVSWPTVMAKYGLPNAGYANGTWVGQKQYSSHAAFTSLTMTASDGNFLAGSTVSIYSLVDA